jgi:hypothetical protein
MRSFTIKAKKLWWMMLFPEKYEEEGSLFFLSFLVTNWLQAIH